MREARTSTRTHARTYARTSTINISWFSASRSFRSATQVPRRRVTQRLCTVSSAVFFSHRLLSFTLYYLSMIIIYVYYTRVACMYVSLRIPDVLYNREGEQHERRVRTVANRAWCSWTEFRRLRNPGGLVFLSRPPSLVYPAATEIICSFFRRMRKTYRDVESNRGIESWSSASS